VDDDRFVPFAHLLRAGTPPGSPAAEACEPAQPPHGPAPAVVAGPLAGEVALLRAAALEAFERASERLLQGLAAEVLGRDLALAPCDIETLTRRFVAELMEFEPLALVLSPADANRVRSSLPVRVDSALRSGDAIVEVRDGAFESRAAFRLESSVAAALREAA
jgi:hypothetical protein